MGSYHDAGTCTFYGTANSNQMLMEMMGLHVPGAAFVHPNTPLRHALTVAATQRVAQTTALGADYLPFVEVIDERSFVNAIVGLMATGGSTNHVIHLVAMARACGLTITWDDMADISRVTPLLARVYPNGEADVNQFHAAGGMALRGARAHQCRARARRRDDGLGSGPRRLCEGSVPGRHEAGVARRAGEVARRKDPAAGVESVLGGWRPQAAARQSRPLGHQDLGRAIRSTGTSPRRRACSRARKRWPRRSRPGIEGDFIAVVRGQGPRANGMPELHKLIPALSGLLAKGRRVAIVTDGRMSGASGKVPSAIHLTPEAAADGPISRLRDGDIIRLDARAGVLEAQVDAATLRGARAGEARGDRIPRTAWAASCSRGCAKARRRRTRARRSCSSLAVREATR